MMQLGIFVHVLEHSSTSVLAFVELAGTVPAVLWMPFAGAVADRRDARTLALASMVVQAVSVAAMAVFFGIGPWAIAVLYGVQGAANALWPPARQRWLYAVVPQQRWAAANAAIGSVSGVMTIAGAALGGVLCAWSIAGAFAVAAAVQLVSVVPLLAVTRSGAQRPATRTRRALRAELLEGFVALRALPLARSVIWIGIAWGFIGGAYNVLLAAYVTKELHGGGLLLGAFYVVDGLAVIAGSVAAARLRREWHLPAYALAYAVQGAAWGVMFLAHAAVLGATFLALMRVASGVIIALDTTILLAAVPQGLRGRVTSLHQTTYGAVSRVSLGAFGGFLAAAGVTAVGVATGAASVLAGAAWWGLNGHRARSLYRQTAPEPARPDP
jgi:hypothetical protein